MLSAANDHGEIPHVSANDLEEVTIDILGRSAAGHLKAFVERIERLEEDKRPSPRTSLLSTPRPRATASTRR